MAVERVPEQPTPPVELGVTGGLLTDLVVNVQAHGPLQWRLAPRLGVGGVGAGNGHVALGNGHAGDTDVWVANITRIREEVGWSPRTSLADGILATARWLNDDPARVARYAAAAG